jgi:hypothetical protein
MAKRTKTPATPAPTAPVKVGVIDRLVYHLQHGGGTTGELYHKLVEDFPDRASERGGMRVTIQIQLKKLHQKGRIVLKSEQLEGRGVVHTAEPAQAG